LAVSDGKKKQKRKKSKVKADLPKAGTQVLSQTTAGQRLVRQELLDQLWFGEDPFQFADPQWVDHGYPSTNIQPDLIAAILSDLQPLFWLELGTMLGGSAIMAAQGIKELGLGTSICCVDPFTGDVNMWSWEKELREKGEWRFLRLEAGRPTIYDRFLANVRESGHDDAILPILCTALVGIRLLRLLADQGRLSRLPDVIYLDSAHEPDETLLELQNAWSLLQPGGVLFGDDWIWPSVRGDVRKFSQTVPADTARMVAFLRRFDESHLDGNVFLYRGQWVLFKPTS
jgi:predicted O-methyltransferase YrrM